MSKIKRVHPKVKARYKVWDQVKKNNINPARIAKKTNIKQHIVKAILKDLQREKLLKAVKDEHRIIL